MTKTNKISEDEIIKQLKNLSSLISYSQDEQSTIKYKALRIFLLLGLKELCNAYPQDFVQDQLEFINFIAFMGNPNKKQAFKDCLETFDVEITMCFSPFNSQFGSNSQFGNYFEMKAISQTLHSILDQLKE